MEDPTAKYLQVQAADKNILELEIAQYFNENIEIYE